MCDISGRLGRVREYMCGIAITTGKDTGRTSVSNCFIDEYMKDANDAQIKIYLFLLRASGTNLPAGVSDLADRFNLTENDVLRALKYWDKKKVITLLFDQEKNLTGIQIRDLDPVHPGAQVLAYPHAEETTVVETVSAEKPEEPARPVISAGQLKEFKNSPETSVLIFAVEQYLGKPLSPTEMRSLYYMSDELEMTQDLIDYLVQYSVEGGHKSFRYMEEIARSWKEQGIATPKQAAAATRKYNKSVYSIMKQLGKNTDPAPKELSYIDSWVKEMGMPLNVILEACDRTVMNTEKRRFEYADSILKNWKEQGIKTLNDVKALDNARYAANSAESAQKKEGRSSQANNQFNRFTKGNVNYEEMLEKIKVN